MPNNEWPYVIAAYAAAWAALVGYTIYLHGVSRRAGRLRDVVAAGTAAIERAANRGGPGRAA